MWTRRKLISLLTNDFDLNPRDIIDIYRKRWIIELLFKQIKQNFPLKYFCGESANAIQIQIWVTLIANLFLMVMKRQIRRSWSFSGLATLMRIVLMYYVDFYSLFELPESDWEAMFEPKEAHRNQIFWLGDLLKRKLTECNLFTKIARPIEYYLRSLADSNSYKHPAGSGYL